MKKNILKLFHLVCLIFYRSNFEHMSGIQVLKLGFIQRVLGFNRHVPWPVHYSSQILAPEKIIPGTRSPGMSMSCFIDGRNGIEFGDNVWIGPRVSIISQDHDASDYNSYLSSGPIVIGSDSLLATNAIILPGVVLGRHTIVAAGAVVTKSFTDGFQILAGNPARVVKKLSEN